MNRELFLSSLTWLHRISQSALDEMQKTMILTIILAEAKCCFEIDDSVAIFSCTSSSEDATMMSLEISIASCDSLPMQAVGALFFKIDGGDMYLVNHTHLIQIVFPKSIDSNESMPAYMIISWPGINLRIWLPIQNDLGRQKLKAVVQHMQTSLTSEMFRHTVLTSEEETPDFSALTPPLSEKLEDWVCCSIIRRLETLISAGPRIIEECGQLMEKSLSDSEKESALTSRCHIDEVLLASAREGRESNIEVLFYHVDNVHRIFRESMISTDEYQHIQTSIQNVISSLELQLNALLDEYCSQKSRNLEGNPLSIVIRDKDELYGDIEKVINKIKYLEENLCLLRIFPRLDSSKPFTFM